MIYTHLIKGEYLYTVCDSLGRNIAETYSYQEAEQIQNRERLRPNTNTNSNSNSNSNSSVNKGLLQDPLRSK